MPEATSSILVICGGCLTIFRNVAMRIVRPRMMSWTTNRQPSKPLSMSALSKTV